ncbi:GNAT family N-acetyltransferase [Myxococcota bacterium]|nr:GNAT family N-acetyltransferase [Myxococcota bacterium]MBU1535188.1 GNAT family N-acetyltransferase [Myxococcota bacterium]
MEIRPMTIDDYQPVMDLLALTSGVVIRTADSPEATTRYLERNPGLSFVAVERGKIVGCVMGSEDGRRGYLQHLAVAAASRHQGLGSRLVATCIDALGARGIHKSHVFVFRDNEAGCAFWENRGWDPRNDLALFTHIASDDPNA